MPTKSKIAYLMHVDWDWIKQRPHFLYEELTRYYAVDLIHTDKIYDKHSGRNRNSRNVHSASAISTLRKLPLSGRFQGLRQVEKLLNRKVIRSLSQYDYIWITSPILLDFISLEPLKQKIVIYDCMDDFLGFYPDSYKLNRLRELEICLVERADVMFTSSEYLKYKMVKSYGKYMKSEPVVINNGISNTLLKDDRAVSYIEPERDTLHSNLLNLMYIGTIGKWIDFAMILHILDQIPDCMLTMVGPVETTVPAHSRMHLTGSVKHDELTTYARTADVFIMPFVLNELVRAVDPVKIYEYISFGKPIIAINYDEMHKFLPFVYLYSNEKEFTSLVKQAGQGKLTMYDQHLAMDFLQASTWEERGKRIISILEGVH
ncbi:glycosyltransferase [Paenibacillus barengoltzii]|uniref:glycosyltransferase n=1 Tax=Paenibacillus barengoltzii TaxID=343517 RepID=UPI000FD78681|nr:glycosyltransferase [Paenibacillus barengoltzii]